MKCPVCDQENSTMLCARCGFDASRDYEQYPTFGVVGSVPSLFTLRRKQNTHSQEKLEQISALLSSLLAVRYLKLLKEDPYVQAAHLQIQTLSAELDREKSASRQAYIRNRELLADLAVSSLYSENASESQKKLEDEIRSLTRSRNALEKKNQTLEKDIQKWKDWNANSSRYNGSLVKSIRKLETDVSALQADLERANARTAELEAALEDERRKGLVARIFNR